MVSLLSLFESETMCNCRDKKSCPLDGKCLQHNVVYKATITTNSETKEYIGSTGVPFKKRWYSQSSDVKNEKNNGTELSKYVWKLKSKSTNYEIKWNIMHKIGEVLNKKDFYPSITKEHLLKAIELSNQFTKSTNDEIDHLMHTCQTIICYDNRIWTKLNNTDNFDIAMGSFHGAEVCDLVGLYILSKLSPIVGAPNIGLYRDDGLGVIKQSSKEIKKTIISEMLKIGFDIIINIGNTSTDFLDVTLDLS